MAAEDDDEREREARDEAEGRVVEAERVGGRKDGEREAERAAEKDGREARGARGDHDKGRAEHAEACPALRERGAQRRRERLRGEVQRHHARRQAHAGEERVAPQRGREHVDCGDMRGVGMCEGMGGVGGERGRERGCSQPWKSERTSESARHAAHA